jgi:hypothetical protein
VAAPAFSAVAVCNRAFAAIEHRGFEDFADGSQEGQDAALHWDAARRFVLTAAPWSFATAFGRADGAIDAPAPAATPFVVVLAPDCLFFRGVDLSCPHRAVPFGDRLLRTDVAPPFTYEYTADVTDLFALSPGCVEALVFYLAHLLAPAYTRAQGRARQMLDRYQLAVAEAAAIDARQGPAADHRPASAARGWWGDLGMTPP